MKEEIKRKIGTKEFEKEKQAEDVALCKINCTKLLKF